MKFKFLPELVDTDIIAIDKVEAIHSIANLLIQHGYVDHEYPQLVLKREKEYPTGLLTKSVAIAIPHSFDENIHGNHVAIGVLKDSVFFRNMEDVDQDINVKIIFMLAVSKAKEQLEMLKILMEVFKNEHLLQDIACMNNRNAICEKLNAFIEEM